MVTEKTSEKEDLRIGLFLLKQSGENAENKSSKIITLENVNEAISSLALEDLDENTDEDLLDIIKENSGKSQAEIFKIYEQKKGKSYRTFQRKISDFKKSNKINTKEEQGNLGKHTILEYLD